MRFLVDECAGPRLARWLPSEGHGFFSVYDRARGADDDEVVDRAFQENRILITTDKDYGEKVFREKRSHCGVVLLRLQDERPENKIQVLSRLIRAHGLQLLDQFVVVTERQVRFAENSHASL